MTPSRDRGETQTYLLPAHHFPPGQGATGAWIVPSRVPIVLRSRYPIWLLGAGLSAGSVGCGSGVVVVVVPAQQKNQNVFISKKLYCKGSGEGY